ncbi:DNA polymerase IV [Bacillus cereus]|uniref:DNA polymerase IV n=1 Tax=Bacillus cereus TaxID=1396 RepID=A0A9X7CHB4_BACCE|nr:DNA polymerase IV [Bacillus cereus]
MNENEYRKQIVSFALQAKELFNKSSEKIISNEFERSMYTDFWTEYDHLLNKYK